MEGLALIACALEGPSLFLASWINDGDPPLIGDNFAVWTTKRAKQLARDYAALGYDFIKIYTNLSRKITDVFLKQGRRLGLPVVGHVPTDYPLRKLLATNMRSMEHLLGFAAAVETLDSPWRGRWTFRRVVGSIPIEAEGVEALAKKVATSGIWSCPTLIVGDYVGPEDRMLAQLDRRDYRWAPRPLLGYWRNSKIPLLAELIEREEISVDEFAVGRERRREFVRALHEAGAGLLVGTDAPVNTVIPGLSIHREMRSLREAGLSDAEVLRAATWNAAQALGVAGEHGTVEPGKKADLILVRRNPLKGIGNLQKLEGVMLDGRWFRRRELNRMWRRAVAKYPDIDIAAATSFGHPH